MGEYVIAIDVGGTKIKAGIFDQQLQLVMHTEVKTKPVLEYEEFLQVLYDLLQSISQKNNLSLNVVKAIAIGVPGFVTNQDTVLQLPNIGITNFNLARDLNDKIGIKVKIDNDANYAALGEWDYFLNKKLIKSEVLALVTVGTGIGCGIVVAGNIFRGASGLAGEIGHFPLGDNYSKLCGCGNRGCLETEVSVRGLATAYDANALDDDYDLIVRSMFKKMDDKAVVILRQKANLLARELVKLACIINPDYLVIGGGIGEHAGVEFIRTIAERFQYLAPPLIAERTSIISAELGNKAGIYGAAVAAWRG